MSIVWVLLLSIVYTDGDARVEEARYTIGEYRTEHTCQMKADKINTSPEGVETMLAQMQLNRKLPTPKLWSVYEQALCHKKEVER